MSDIVLGPAKDLLKIAIIIIVLSALAFALPFILRKIYKRKNVCVCGEELKPTDAFCPKCGKKVEK